MTEGPSGPRVLLVEDEHDLAEVVRMNLQLRGYEVAVAGDGAEGLERARAEQPDLILLDIMLPVLSGWEVLAAVKRDERLRDVPVVMLTALSEERDIIRGHLEGAVRYVTKPFEVKKLMATVEEALVEPDEEELVARRERVARLLQRLAELDAGRTGNGARVHLTRLESPPPVDTGPPLPSDAELQRVDQLTDKQRRLASLLAAGHSARDIARILGVSRTNVYATRKRVARKLQVPADHVADEAARLGLAPDGAEGSGAVSDPSDRQDTT